MKFSYAKELEKVQENLQRLEKTQSKKSIANAHKKVMFSEDVIISKH